MDFLQDRRRRDRLVLANGMLEQLGAHTSRDEHRDQHARVEDQPHDTRSKTSSSVKMPCACAVAIMRCRSARKRLTKK